MGPQKKAKLVYNSNFTMVYDIYNYSNILGLLLTNVHITIGGPTLYGPCSSSQTVRNYRRVDPIRSTWRISEDLEQWIFSCHVTPGFFIWFMNQTHQNLMNSDYFISSVNLNHPNCDDFISSVNLNHPNCDYFISSINLNHPYFSDIPT